jgi:hypothetical protein
LLLEHDLFRQALNYSPDEIKRRVNVWKDMGADGIFFDDFGYDWGTSRARQNEAVDHAHSQGMPVIANAFRPEDAFGSQIHVLQNPSGTPTSLNASDFYLYESHQIREGQFVPEMGELNWQDKANKIRSIYRNYSKDTGLLQAARASCKVWRVW